MQWGEGVKCPYKKCYEGVLFNVIMVTRRWVGVKCPDKKCYEGILFHVIRVTRGWVGVKFPEKTLRNI